MAFLTKFRGRRFLTIALFVMSFMGLVLACASLISSWQLIRLVVAGDVQFSYTSISMVTRSIRKAAYFSKTPPALYGPYTREHDYLEMQHENKSAIVIYDGLYQFQPRSNGVDHQALSITLSRDEFCASAALVLLYSLQSSDLGTDLAIRDLSFLTKPINLEYRPEQTVLVPELASLSIDNIPLNLSVIEPVNVEQICTQIIASRADQRAKADAPLPLQLLAEYKPADPPSDMILETWRVLKKIQERKMRE